MHTALLYKQYLTSQFPDYVALLLLSVHSEGKLAQSRLIRAPREQAAELRELGKDSSGSRPKATSKFQVHPAAGQGPGCVGAGPDSWCGHASTVTAAPGKGRAVVVDPQATASVHEHGQPDQGFPHGGTPLNK